MMNDFVVKINNEGKCILITIRRMLSQHVEEAVDCFNDHFDVFDCPSTVLAFLHQDPQAFFIAIENESLKVIGVCGAPLGLHQTHFFGLYGIRPEYRSHGIGSILFEQCMKHVGFHNAGLYAVPNMIQKYITKGGFQIRENVSMVNFLGIPEQISHSGKKDIQIIQLNADNIEKFQEKIIEYDGKIHDGSREKLIKFILKDQSYRTCMAINSNDSSIQGYGCLRQHSITKRFYLGPLYSNDVDSAQLLIESLIKTQSNSVQENGLVWNALDSNPLSLDLAKKFALQEIERCERIFTKYPIRANYRCIYSVFSPDFSL